MLTPCIAFIASLMALHVVPSESDPRTCGRMTVWRNYNMTCPERAVCADVFETTRNWYNGTTCGERRVLHNCMCVGETPTICPFNDDNHMLHVSRQHKQYTCRPACSLPWCNGINRRPNSEPTIAISAEQQAVEFGDRTYYMMHCRCPRHHVPYTQRRGFHRAVTAYSHRYSTRRRRYHTLYMCNNFQTYGMTDPCN